MSARETTLRVRYAETDAQGIVNNAAYLSYFEVGRVEWLRSQGFSYRGLEEAGYGLVVAEACLRYRKAARFDDELVIRTELAKLDRASLRFEYTILRNGEEVASGYTHHACVKLGSGKLCRMPEELLEVLGRGR